MRFFRNSSEILADELGRVRAVRLAKTRLEEIGTKRVAVTTGETEDIPVMLLHGLHVQVLDVKKPELWMLQQSTLKHFL